MKMSNLGFKTPNLLRKSWNPFFVDRQPYRLSLAAKDPYRTHLEQRILGLVMGTKEDSIHHISDSVTKITVKFSNGPLLLICEVG